VLYALTGNYKSDQVHIPALLERIGANSLPDAMVRPDQDASPPPVGDGVGETP
jgi:hypothetical protein